MADLPKLAIPAQRALASVSVAELEDLTRFTESHIAELHGMGPNALKKLKQALADEGLSFKPD